MFMSHVCVVGVVLMGVCLFIPVLKADTTQAPSLLNPTTSSRDHMKGPDWDSEAVLISKHAQDPGTTKTHRSTKDPGTVKTHRPTQDPGGVNTIRATQDHGAVNARRPTRDTGVVNTRRPTQDPGAFSTRKPVLNPVAVSTHQPDQDLGTVSTPVHSHPEITKLSSKTDFLMRKLRQLEKDRDSDRDKIRELERHSIENNDDAIRGLAMSMELQHHVTEIQDRLTQLEENVDNYRFNMNNMRFEQEQIKTEMDMYKKLKDSTRRSFRKLDRQFGKYSLRLENLENDIRNVSSNVNIVLEIFQDGMKDNVGKIQNLEELIENRTKPFFEGNFRHIKSRMNRLDQNMTLPRSTLELVPNEEGSGNIDTDYILTSIQESSNHIDTGSGEVPGILPHTHSQYLNTEDFILEIQDRDEEISDLETTVDELKASLVTMETRLSSIQLGDFMGKLQESLLNFTQNVITLDQWKMASTDIFNSTQFNQRQITSLTNMILNNTNHVRDVEWKVADVQSLGYQQFNLLRMYVIQLNNTVQDMKDTMSNLRKAQQQQQLNLNREPVQPAVVNVPAPDKEHLDTLKTRVEDLSLQIIYNENRISKLEIHALNESLFECKKYNKDNDQDTKITHINRQVSKLIETEIMVKEMLKRLDRGLFRIHLDNNNQSDVIKDMVREIEHLNSNVTAIDELKQEVDHVRFMLPRDCDEYYQRGHRLSGLYVIYPANASRSLKVSCDMEDGSGGWTLIQRRIDGREEFARGWEDYKAGFGSSENELWLGNDLIHSLTYNKNLSLKIDMVDMEDKYWTVTYSHFRVGNEDSKYKLYVDGYQGNATDSLQYSDEMGFSTPDRDNDGSSTNCAMYYTAGWWYKHCHYSNLNGRYQLGMVWYNYDKGEWIQLKRASMKVKAFVV